MQASQRLYTRTVRPLTRARASATAMGTTAAPPTQSSQRIEETLQKLQAKKGAWAETPLSRKIELLKQVQARLTANISSWGESGARVRGLDDDKVRDIAYRIT